MSYTTATFARLDKNADGTAAMIFRYTGNSGEIPVERSVPVNTSIMPSADWSRSIAMEHMAILNTNLSFYAGALGAVGTVLDTTTPLPASSAVYGAYHATTAPFTPGATPQDIFTISGSATRSIRVTGVGLYTVQTTAGINTWMLNKLSTANSGGTSATIVAVPDDATNPAASGVVRQYTANPTAGTLVGAIWSGKVVSPAPASVASVIGKELNYSRKPIILTGTSQVLSWNFGGAALPSGLSVQAWVSWEEIA